MKITKKFLATLISCSTLGQSCWAMDPGQAAGEEEKPSHTLVHLQKAPAQIFHAKGESTSPEEEREGIIRSLLPQRNERDLEPLYESLRKNLRNKSLEDFGQLYIMVDIFSRDAPGSDKFLIISTLAKILPIRFTPAFVDAVKNLSLGIDADHRYYVIKALGKVEEKQFVKFIAAVNMLTQDMINHNKCCVIEALAEVPAECLTQEFVEAVNSLTQGMDGFNRSAVIEALAAMRPECLAKTLIDEVNNLTQGKDEYSKVEIIKAIGRCSPKSLSESTFVDAENALTQDLKVIEKHWVIGALINIISSKPLAETFVDVATSLTQGMHGLDRSRVITTLATMPLERFTETFIHKVNNLTQGMDEGSKVEVIKALSKMPPKCILTEFVSAVNSLTQGMDNGYRPRVVRGLVKLLEKKPETILKIANALTRGVDEGTKANIICGMLMLALENLTALRDLLDEKMPELIQCVPASQRVQLVLNLETTPSTKWSAEITKAIERNQ